MSERRRRSASSTRKDLELALGGQLSALLSAARAFTAESVAAFDPPLTSAAFQVVQWLQANGPSRASTISDALAMDRSALSRLIKPLLERSLVVAQGEQSDGRVTIYGLSDLGRTQMEKAMSSKGARFHDQLASWEDDDLAELTRLLGHLLEATPPH